MDLFGTTEIKSYMTSVYATAFTGVLAASVGAKAHLDGYVHAGFLWTLAQIGFSMGIALTMGNSYSNTQRKVSFSFQRYGLFLGFALTLGINIGSWVAFCSRTAGYSSIQLDNQLVFDAFVLTTLVFSVFTVAGLVATTQILFIALCIAGTGGLIIFWSSVASLFGILGAGAFDLIYIRLGLVVVSMYILVDTWKIKNQAERGMRDVITHSMILLSDFAQTFVRVLFILAKGNKNKKKN